MTSSSIDMNAISDKELIAEFLERFAVPNFFSKKHVEEAHGDLTDDQWEKFKTDYNHSSSVHSEASKTFVDDVECMFDTNYDYESEDESEDEDEEVLCSDCKTPLDHLRDGTETEGHRCNNCYWEQESKTAKDREAIIEPDYRIDASDEEEKCPSCKKYYDDDEDPCSAGCPLYDAGEKECDFASCDDCLGHFHEDELSAVCFNEKCKLFQMNCCEKCCAANKCSECGDEEESEEGITGAEFWDEMGEMFGYDLRPNHPLWSAFLLYKKMKQEEKEA